MLDRKSSCWVIALAAVGLCGCGEGSDDAGLGPSGAAGSGGSAAAGGFGAFGGSAGGGAGGGSAGGGTGGTTGPDMRIDPIELGYAWTYDVIITGVYPLCKAGSLCGGFFLGGAACAADALTANNAPMPQIIFFTGPPGPHPSAVVEGCQSRA